MIITEIYKIEDSSPSVVKHLDKPREGYISDLCLPLCGWAHIPGESIEEIFVKINNEIIASAKCDIPRPRLKKKLGEDVEVNVGFKASVPGEAIFGKQFVLVMTARTTTNCELELWKLHGRQTEGYGSELLGKKLFYMHIAKTGGTSVNTFINSHYPYGACREHIEAIHLNKAKRLEVLENKLFLSGHITLEVALLRGYIDKDFKTFTILRNPIDQLMSHLSWVKRLSFPEYRNIFESHPEHIQDIAIRLGSLSLEEFIISLTPTEKDLFDNVQTRYLSNTFNKDLNPDDVRRALVSLDKFDVLGINENLSESLQLLSAVMGWPEPDSDPPRENISQFKLSLDEFNEKEISLLNQLIVSDKIVYKRSFDKFKDSYAKVFGYPLNDKQSKEKRSCQQ